MVKVFYFGKYDFEGKGKTNSVEIEICLQDKKDGKVFTASGYVWNRTHKDCIMGGQCLDDIADNCKEIANDETFKKIYKFWKLYHLNDMHAGTKEQEKFIAKHQQELKNIFEELQAQKKYSFEYISHYDATCELLKRHNLYEVQYKGKPYKYGHAWLFEKIPAKDLKEIEKLFEK